MYFVKKFQLISAPNLHFFAAPIALKSFLLFLFDIFELCFVGGYIKREDKQTLIQTLHTN